jgi:CBS domain-containing protein
MVMYMNRGITVKPESRRVLWLMVVLAGSQRLCLHEVLKKCAPVSTRLISGFFFLVQVQRSAGESGYKSIHASAFWRHMFLMLDEYKVDQVVAMSLKVEDAMIDEVVTIEADATVKKAVELMNKHEIGCLIAVRSGKAVGILTERDMLSRVLGMSRDPERTKVSEIMTSPLVVADPQMDLEEAARLMFKMKVKKLPVVSRGDLVGLLTLTDIARFQPQIIKILKRMYVKNQTPKRMQKVVDYYVV